MNYPKFLSEEEFFQIHNDLSSLDIAQGFSKNLQQIHRLTTSQYLDLNELMKSYLSAGLKIFKMEFGIVSKIDQNNYVVLDAVSPGDVLEPGAVFELEGTYCREVYKSKQVIGFPHVGSLKEFKGHPVYVNMKLESYISAPIYKYGKIFGTLNFSSTKIRKNLFSSQERVLIEMMAASIGSFLELKDKEDKLNISHARMRKLINYVAHDLRSPLGNIESLSQFVIEENGLDQNGYLNKIIEISQDATEIVQTILEASLLNQNKIQIERKTLSLDEVLKNAVEEFQEKLSSNNLTIQLNIDSVMFSFDENRMRQVFSNLLSNAFKYSIVNSIIKISLKETNGEIYFSLQNEYDPHKVIIKGHDLTDGGSIGFGLEIINELLILHQSELEINKDEKFFKTSFKFKKDH